MVTKTEAISNFLLASTHPDLASMYNPSMECQVNVGQDGGDRVDGEFKGRKWQAWSDGTQTWKSFRIPYNANSEPSYDDRPMSYDLAAHAEGIGLTGWDWKNRVSRWVGFDFDAITGHSDKHAKKLDDSELRKIQEVVTNIPWVTVRYSTGGKGLHLYVYLNPTPTANHNEHAAIARSIIGKLAGITGFDFQSKVDVCGGNLWIWHRKMKGTDGLKLIKEGTRLDTIPENWRDHLNVISGKKRKVVPGFIQSSEKEGVEKLFDELNGQRSYVELDEDHKKLMKWLEENEAMWAWDQDSRILTTHTYDLKLAHQELGFKGIYDTLAKGTERGQDWNCWCTPRLNGGWSVRRFTQGVAESSTWSQDGQGWTSCYYNMDPDLRLASRANEGVEDPDKGGFRFREAQVAAKAAQELGVDLQIPTWASSRKVWLRPHKDGRLIAELDREDTDTADDLLGWKPDKKVWKKVFNAKTVPPREVEVGNYDEMVRHLVSESGGELTWALKGDGLWREKVKDNIRTFLTGALDLSSSDANKVMGSCIMKPWTIVNRPFQPELVGDRQWNRNAAQLKYLPTENKDNLTYPTWMSILNHCGAGLNEAIKVHSWCKANGILTGADYLKCWIASMFQEPDQPLPYLFFYSSQQSTGKSTLHEALSLLTTKGVARADNALVNQQGFNGELEGAILCVVEETDLRRNKQAYNRIKDWVTSPVIQIHAKGQTPFSTINTSHWIQCLSNRNWILTESGLRRVKDLINKPFNAIIDGRKYKTNGFYKTGTRDLYRVITSEGIELELTNDHEILVDFDGIELWTQVQHLVPGCKIKLHKHKDFNCTSFETNGTFGEGYLLGCIVGDGTIDTSTDISRIELFENDESLIPTVTNGLGLPLIGNWSEKRYTICDTRLCDLHRKYKLTSAKEITDGITKESSKFLQGFLSALFDTDGGIDIDYFRITLGQSNYKRLQTVQQLLLMFGINSKIRKIKDGGRAVICGTPCNTKSKFVLRISKDNLKIFEQRIGFKHSDKSQQLKNIIKKREISYSKRQDSFTVTFKSLEFIGHEEVYDVTVPGPNHFCANGIKTHNCANDINYCPSFQGDTRITMSEVYPFDPLDMRTKKELIPLLQKEAPDFMAEIMGLEIPPSNDRLNVPVVATEEKMSVELANRSFLEIFLHEVCYHVTGKKIKYDEFYDKFKAWLDPGYLENWSKIRVGRSLPKQHPKGRWKDAQFYIGNVAWEPKDQSETIEPELILKGDRLGFRD